MNQLVRILIVIALFFFACAGHTQIKKDTLEPESIWQLMKYDGKTAFGGLKHAYTRPLYWKGKDFLTLGGVALGTYILYTFDEESSEYFIKQEEDIPELVQDFGWYFGAPQNTYMLYGGIYGVGLLTRNEKLRHTGVLLIASATAAGFIQTLSKNAFGRARPLTFEGRGSFKPFSSEGAYHSFPSGHAILSFTTAHAIARQFDSWWVKAPIYLVGSIAPASRLWVGSHWLTDVALGMALSVVIVDSIDNYLKDTNKYDLKKKKKVTWRLNVGANRLGVVGTF
ncbi:MAG: phosphatase PAP2 family protein [Flavobacteriaceae bacterium]|nr:phosphatase PAP2 family protein [Flavobacteriaceae bacterium]